MDEEEFQEYLEWSVRNYAEEKVKAGSWPGEGAYERSKGQFDMLLPNGRNTPNSHLFKIVDNEAGKRVGTLWFGIASPPMEVQGGFIWDIIIFPEFRGMGYGKQAMIALEEKARELGVNRISLHVFGHNNVAIGLYRKLGYSETDLMMSKDI